MAEDRMAAGELLAIFLVPRRCSELQPVDQAEAVAGRGLRGDRYFRQNGIVRPSREVTLIESESLQALFNEAEIVLSPQQTRRNLLTRGVHLNQLVGQEFSVGAVVLRGVMLCEPCGHLEALTVPGVKKGLRGRGGLRAQIVRGGILRPGNPISLDDVALR